MLKKAWRVVKEKWESFDIDFSPESHLFKRRLANQNSEHHATLPNRPHMPFAELKHFINFALIAEEPIRQDTPHSKYPNSPYTYLINSGDSGMRLYYDEDDLMQIKTKRAAIIIGGDILSRGLTIEGPQSPFWSDCKKNANG